jgi:hypothetical protein
VPVPPIQGYAGVTSASCGAVSVPFDLNAMTAAFNAAGSEDRLAFLQALQVASVTTPEFVCDTFEAQSSLQSKCTTKQILQTMLEEDLLATEVSVSTTGPSTLTWSLIAGGILLLTLVLGDDILSSCGCTPYPLFLPTCTPGGEDSTQKTIMSPSMPDPSNPGNFLFLGDGLQCIVDMLSKLLNGSNPCRQSDYTFGGTGSNVIHMTSDNPVYGFMLEIVENPNPARINWQPPMPTLSEGVQRFGKFNFTNGDGQAGSVQFYNLNTQEFLATDDQTLSATVYLNPDVVINWYFRDLKPFPGDTVIWANEIPIND